MDLGQNGREQVQDVHSALFIMYHVLKSPKRVGLSLRL